MVALELLIAQLPPVTLSDNATVAPMQTADAPTIVPGPGSGSMVITFTARPVPQVVTTEYMMVSTPPAMPVTTPADTEALALLALHVPPGAPSVSAIVAPT